MPRVTLFAIVEGQTENAVLTRLLGAHLGAKGIDLHCPIVRLGGGRGGVSWLECEELCDQIQRHLKDRRRPYVTAFFDYYGFPTGHKAGWAFVERAKAEVTFRGLDATAGAIENELHRLAITGLDLPNLDKRFFPYVQLHELEALFFAEPEKMAALFEAPALGERFPRAVTECGGCEQIDDTPQNAPSKRIEAAFPGYKKGRSDLAHGPRLASKLSLEIVRRACPRFSVWLHKMEALAPPEPAATPRLPPQAPQT
jgi:hypothetical protein